MADNDQKEPLERMVAAYESMLQRVDEMLKVVGERTVPTLKSAFDHAREKAVELDELTSEEAEKIADYVKRDLHDAANFMADNADGFRDWLRFDLELIESRALEMFISVADKTRLELARLAERAREGVLYHTGEITGPGTLVCSGCGKTLNFHKAGHIPPCPQCRGTRYKRHKEG